MPGERSGEGRATNMKDDLDISLEIVVLLVLATFMLLFGVLLLGIRTGALPYSPDSTYGLFLVIVSFQVVTLGKSPFGDLRRSWALVVVGMCAGILGNDRKFPPGLRPGSRSGRGRDHPPGRWPQPSRAARRLGAKSRDSGIRAGGILRQLAIACALVYALSIILGATTLLPGLHHGCANRHPSHRLRRGLCLPVMVPAEGQGAVSNRRAHAGPGGRQLGKPGSAFSGEASLPLPVAIIDSASRTMLTLLGLSLVPVNLGLLAFSADGQLGLLLTVMAIQMMTLGETPVGQFRRSWPLLVVGLVFAALGVVSSVVPGLLTGTVRNSPRAPECHRRRDFLGKAPSFDFTSRHAAGVAACQHQKNDGCSNNAERRGHRLWPVNAGAGSRSGLADRPNPRHQWTSSLQATGGPSFGR